MRFAWRRFAPVILAGLLGLLGGCAAPPVPPGGEHQPASATITQGQASDRKAHTGSLAAPDLPPEAQVVLESIRRGPPYPYSKDGTTFQNREGRLPARPRGYYREFTVRTPGQENRGARRIVAGDGGELYYTDDHYRTFREITP
jgi:ribonuclease T1